jgi:uncharacterized protein (UPF0261 family)
VLTVDVGVLGRPAWAADVPRERVAEASGAALDSLARAGDRGAAIEAMGRGAAVLVRELSEAGAMSAVLALGGSGGASVAAQALAALPLGFPKLVVSPVAAGETRPYVGGTDIALMNPVVDLAGLNPISASVLANAAAAVAGMARAAVAPSAPAGPLVAMTMFGITTPCVDRVRALLAEQGYVPLVFSANGAGGDAMEQLIAGGTVAGVIDVTTTELADRLVGGILAAGERRLEGAGAAGLPQVVVPGALDCVNFGPWDSVPERFRRRRLHRHNPQVTLLRTSAHECATLGRTLAAKVNAGHGPRSVVVPLGGLSALSAPGAPFHDPVADQALFDALRDKLARDVELVELDCHINDPVFAAAVADRFAATYQLSNKEPVTR